MMPIPSPACATREREREREWTNIPSTIAKENLISLSDSITHLRESLGIGYATYTYSMLTPNLKIKKKYWKTKTG